MTNLLSKGTLMIRIVATLCCLAVAAPVWCGTFRFTPAQPTSRDPVRIVFHEEEWFSPCAPTPLTVTVREGRILLRAAPYGGCNLLFVHNPYSWTVEVGPLPAGTYSVVAESLDPVIPIDVVSSESELTVAAEASPPPAPPVAAACPAGPRPAATLLLPYFEVDLEDPDGRTTLFSVNNATATPALAHAVVWTNWGVPVLSFDLALAGHGVVTFNLRDVIGRGKIPRTTIPEGASFPGCVSPVVVPGPHLAELQAHLTGRTVEPIICLSSPVEGGRLATGFVTVDVVHGCSPVLRYPGDDGYFGDDGGGLAADDNVLWGDFFLVDPSQDSSQGAALVTVVADAGRFGPEHPGTTFYGVEDHRAPIGHEYRARFLRGGAFDGGTDLVVWSAKRWPGSESNCTESPTNGGPLQLRATFRDEAGSFDGEVSLLQREWTRRLHVGEAPLAAGSSFGSAAVSFGYLDPHHVAAAELLPVPSQGWVMPLMRAEGRFSVGVEPTLVAGSCGTPEP